MSKHLILSHLALQSTESFIQMMQYCLHTLEEKSAYKITESERLSKILNFVVLKIMNFLVVTVSVRGGGWEVMSFNSNYNWQKLEYLQGNYCMQPHWGIVWLKPHYWICMLHVTKAAIHYNYCIKFHINK